MRVVIAVCAAAIVLAVAPSSRASVFPDLPGMKAVGHFTHGQDTATKVRASSAAQGHGKRAPVGSERATVFPDLPGEGSLPAMGDVARRTSAREGTTLPLVLLAVGVVLVVTRFLVRLNSLGRRTA